jgi:ribonuclease HIII
VKERIGVDESGKGDYFGPLVIAACLMTPEAEERLGSLKESKALPDPKVMSLEKLIKDHCPHEVVTISPPKYNELYEKIRNLNNLLAWGHARAIETLLQKHPVQDVIVDQFAHARVLRRALMTEGRSANVHIRVRAEEDSAVAAASILARARFLRYLRWASGVWGLSFPKGAGPGVLQAAQHFVALHGFHNLKEVAKLHFKITERIQQQPPTG